MVEARVPHPFERVYLLPDLRRGVGVMGQDLRRLVRRLHAQYEQHRAAFAGGERYGAGQGAARVFIVAVYIAEVAGRDAGGVAVAVVAAEECLPVAAVARHRRAGQAEEPLGDPLVVHLFIGAERVEIAVDLLHQAVFGKDRSADKQGVLQIDLVLLIVAVIRKFGVAG